VTATRPDRRRAAGDAAGPGPVRIAIVNDFEVIVRGLSTMLQPWRDRLAVVELEVGGAPDRAVDVALLDTFGQADRIPERVAEILESASARHLAIYTFDFRADIVARVFGLGVSGYFSKACPAEQLAEDLVAVAGGRRIVHDPPRHRQTPAARRWPGQERGLSEREAEALSLLARGLTNREVARAMNLNENTVKTHLKSVYRKLDLANRVAATRFALDAGLVAD
jgi:DNA-binding NarL/FixJ family response regulator